MVITNTEYIFRNQIQITSSVKKFRLLCDRSVAKPSLEPCYKFQCFMKAYLLKTVLRLLSIIIRSFVTILSNRTLI